MKLRNKVLIASSLVLIIALTFVYIGSHYFLATNFARCITFALCFSFALVWLMHKLVIKRIEELNQEILSINKDKADSGQVNISGHDEITSISKQINRILTNIQIAHALFEKRVEERTTELQQEINERKNIEKELIQHKEHLVRLAHYDSLTSLPNRIFFNEMLNKTISHAGRHKKMIGILFINLDRFKNINDALGHAAGDLVLREIADRFAGVLRAGDVLARLDGDEFIILLNDIEHTKFVSPVADKLLQICSQVIKIDSHELFITTSIGICVYPHDGSSLEDLLQHADLAMYKAKKSGGGIFQYYTKEMNVEAYEHIQLEAALRKAITNNEFVLHYQPKLNLNDGTIHSVEALIRWDNPELGMISPADFIPLAEETGLILKIGEWALLEACRTNKSWQEQGYQPIVVAVNLSAKQFRHQDIAQLIANVLADTKLDPRYLELEITETAMMDNLKTASVKLHDIQRMGVSIAVDDFGTGYTSISYLKQFPISVLKIDQTFIKGVSVNQNDAAITGAVIALAHNLGIKVVAEGVETAEQLQYLADNNCDIVQGYYLSSPLPEGKIVLQFQKVNYQAIDGIS